MITHLYKSGKKFYAECPSCCNLPHLSGLGTSIKRHRNVPPMAGAYKPIAIKSMCFNGNNQIFINKQFDHLYSGRIIKPSMSPWHVQILVIKVANDNKPYMFIDYSQTVNLFTKLNAYPCYLELRLINNLAKYHVFSTCDLHMHTIKST